MELISWPDLVGHGPEEEDRVKLAQNLAHLRNEPGGTCPPGWDLMR